jgi:predicted amidophosphoribosyltransferase
MIINPKEIRGNWNHGWALDTHTVRSILTGTDEWGRKTFDTTRSEIGEALYRLKYQDDRRQLKPIANAVTLFIMTRFELTDIQAIIAVPPSDTNRRFQPVQELAAVIGKKLKLPVPTDYLLKIKQTEPLKDMDDRRKRSEALEDAFEVRDDRYRGSHVLVFDDLYRSGETLCAICAALISQGKVGKVSVVTVTMTKSKR